MTSRPRVAVLDYGSGNVHSAVKALAAAGADAHLTADPVLVRDADGLVVPGVGAFAAVIDALTARSGGTLVAERLALGRPVLGICVGMQVMFDRGIERGADTPGLGFWSGAVTAVDAPIVPHMGWNTVTAAPASRLFAGIADRRFYFVHSYAAHTIPLSRDTDDVDPLLTWCEYGAPFLAAVEDGPLSATQFHPEKSGDAGIALLANWLGTLEDA